MLPSVSYIAQLKAAVLSTVNVAMTIGELRDPYTAGHERRVAALAVAIADELGLDSIVQEGFNVAGHLHDVGKVMVPSEILSKPGKLSRIEMQSSRVIARRATTSCGRSTSPGPLPTSFCSTMNASTAPAIPVASRVKRSCIEARILAVADVVEAMSSHRPYRPGLGVTVALAEIERGSGTAYAQDVVDACLRLFREKNYRLPA